jgi:hypothetical protein
MPYATELSYENTPPPSSKCFHIGNLKCKIAHWKNKIMLSKIIILHFEVQTIPN